MEIITTGTLFQGGTKSRVAGSFRIHNYKQLQFISKQKGLFLTLALPTSLEGNVLHTHCR